MPDANGNALTAKVGQGLSLHRQGRLTEAADAYREVLRQQPDHAEVLHLLGVVALQTQQAARAAELIGRAISLQPDFAEAHCNHGLALRILAGPAAAIACYDKAIALQPAYVAAHYNRGNALLELSRVAEAVLSYDQAIAANPDCLAAHFSRAVALQYMGQQEAAVAGYDQVIALKPDLAEAHANRGVALHELMRLDDALASHGKAIALKPDFADAHSNRGNTLQLLRRYNEAIAAYDVAIALNPDGPRAYFNKGQALQAQKRFPEAIESYDSAIARHPHYADALLSRGDVLQELDRFEEAVASYDVAVALLPDNPAAYYNRGNALKLLLQYDAAIASYDKAIELQPAHAEAYSNRGNALLELGRTDEALASFDRAIALLPDAPEAHNNRALVLQDAARPEEALDSYRRALEMRPRDAHMHLNRGMCLLKLGELRRGWVEYEWRWKTPKFSPDLREFDQPLWLGQEPLTGKTILLHAEGGFGDTLQFCRYVLPVVAQGAHVVVEVPRPLVRLMESLRAGRVIAHGDALPPFDLHCPLMSLPLALQTDCELIAAPGPYLAADAASADAWRQRLAALPGRRVGLVWAGSSHLNFPEQLALDRRRSITLGHLAPLASVAGVSFVSLQKGDAATQAGMPPAAMRINDFTDELNDFADTAALVAALDLVISVDTAVAHLAGALGTPVWILNRFDACWRWFLGRSDSPWYAGARLFRQPAPGNWDSVISDVRAALQRWVASADMSPKG